MEPNKLGCDYLAVILVLGGAGSWAREKTKDKAVASAARICRSDFKAVGIKKSTPLTVNVIDVTGFDDVWWDETGFYQEKTKIDRPIEVVKV